MAAEFFLVVFISRLKWKICSYPSEKYFSIKILKPWPPRNLKVFLKKIVLFIRFFVSKEIELCLLWQQRF